jgi:hypothetical protein
MMPKAKKAGAAPAPTGGRLAERSGEAAKK